MGLLADTLLAAGTALVRRVSICQGDPWIVPAEDVQPVVWLLDGYAANGRDITFNVGRGRYTHVGFLTEAGELVDAAEIGPEFLPQPGTVTIRAGRLMWAVP